MRVWLLEHLGIILMFLGIALLAVEMLTAFATYILFFLGLAILITGLAMFLGLLATNWLLILVSILILTGLSAALLLKPLQDMKTHVDEDLETGD
ncbi:MAG: hypothetical protein CMP91_01265 [Gammaproteobacteria bacterium]|nr:hypothetical protein [Gammaproteobacteria bacterium]MAY02841.1 hypothetical protein [Gammaproteobacteria bacterium]|tara:strand:- start:2050 stop:2334 length:285 start_codon:yes stop_codon:yes gene_type:complete